jgi:hypothetical protein
MESNRILAMTPPWAQGNQQKILCTTEPWAPDTGHFMTVGWVDDSPSSQRDPIDPAFVDRLAELLETWESLMAILCVDHCGQCDNNSRTMRYKGKQINITTGRLVVPGENRCYIAPPMILHSIVAHGYVPPREFCDAVMRCPPRGTPEYRAAVQRFWPTSIR